ncbi:MAG: hypothetical protein KI785_08800 [Devosiaceae bacterium]|nr:hypothetical protein [Devosiaceae bacterium MH13]
MQHPLALMLVSVTVYSFFPLMGDLGGDAGHPLMFIGIAHIASLAAYLVAVWLYQANPNTKGGWEALVQLARVPRVLKLSALDGVINFGAHAALFASFTFIFPDLATVIYEAWPVVGMVIVAVLLSGTMVPLSGRQVLLAVMAFLGLAVMVASEFGAWSAFEDPTTDTWIGLSLAVVAMGAMSVSSALAVRIDALAEAAFGAGTTGTGSPEMASDTKSFFPTLAVSVFIKAFSVLVFAVALPFLIANSPDTRLTADQIALAVGTGVLIISIGSVSFRAALLWSRRADYTVLFYLSPIVSVFLLYAFNRAEVSEAAILALIVVVSANLLLRVRVDQTYGFLATFLTLSACALFVFVTEPVQLDRLLPQANLVDLVSVPLGIVGILAAFMLSRIAQNRQQLEVRLVELCRKAGNDIAIKRALFEVVMARGAASAKRCAQTLESACKEWNQRQRDGQADRLDIDLPGLRVQLLPSIAFGEALVLWTLAAFVGLVLLVFRADSYVGDLLAIFIPSTLAYLCVQATNERDDRRVRKVGALMGEGVVEPPRDRTMEAYLAGAIIVALYGVNIWLALERHGAVDLIVAPSGLAR